MRPREYARLHGQHRRRRNPTPAREALKRATQAGLLETLLRESDSLSPKRQRRPAVSCPPRQQSKTEAGQQIVNLALVVDDVRAPFRVDHRPV